MQQLMDNHAARSDASRDVGDVRARLMQKSQLSVCGTVEQDFLAPAQTDSGRSPNCGIFVFFRTYRALFGKTLSTPTQEARPDTLVEVEAQSEHCSSRGKRSKPCFPLGVYKSRF